MTVANEIQKAKAAQKVRLYRMSMPEHECPWGLKAVKLLNEKNIDFEDHRLTSRTEVDEFKEKHNVAATPQIFFDDERIGGYSDLALVSVSFRHLVTWGIEVYSRRIALQE